MGNHRNQKTSYDFHTEYSLNTGMVGFGEKYGR